MTDETKKAKMAAPKQGNSAEKSRVSAEDEDDLLIAGAFAVLRTVLRPRRPPRRPSRS